MHYDLLLDWIGICCVIVVGDHRHLRILPPLKCFSYPFISVGKAQETLRNALSDSLNCSLCLPKTFTYPLPLLWRNASCSLDWFIGLLRGTFVGIRCFHCWKFIILAATLLWNCWGIDSLNSLLHSLLKFVNIVVILHLLDELCQRLLFLQGTIHFIIKWLRLSPL